MLLPAEGQYSGHCRRYRDSPLVSRKAARRRAPPCSAWWYTWMTRDNEMPQAEISRRKCHHSYISSHLFHAGIIYALDKPWSSKVLASHGVRACRRFDFKEVGGRYFRYGYAFDKSMIWRMLKLGLHICRSSHEVMNMRLPVSQWAVDVVERCSSFGDIPRHRARRA